MIQCRLAIIAICAAACALAAARAADETSRYYFDNGAERYTRDDVEKARAWVDEGLQLYPSDTKLILLRQLLEQPPQQQPQSSPNAQQQPQTGEGQDSEQRDEHQQEQTSPSDAPEQQTSSSEEEERPASAMSEEEAERILDALREREASDRARIAADRLRREMSRLPPVEKDW